MCGKQIENGDTCAECAANAVQGAAQEAVQKTVNEAPQNTAFAAGGNAFSAAAAAPVQAAAAKPKKPVNKAIVALLSLLGVFAGFTIFVVAAFH